MSCYPLCSVSCDGRLPVQGRREPWTAHRAVVSTRVILSPMGPLAMSGHMWDWHKLLEDAPGIRWEEAREAAQYPAVQGRPHYKWSGRNVSGVKVEKPWLRKTCPSEMSREKVTAP